MHGGCAGVIASAIALSRDLGGQAQRRLVGGDGVFVFIAAHEFGVTRQLVGEYTAALKGDLDGYRMSNLSSAVSPARTSISVSAEKR